METLAREAIEQKCMAVSLWMTRRATLKRHGELLLAEKANRVIERLIKELREMGK